MIIKPNIWKLMIVLPALVVFLGCESDVNKKESITSGTTTGFGSSGGTPANVSVSPGSTQVASGSTTTLAVFITDSQGNPTNASIILTSSGGGSFEGGASKNVIGGFLVVAFTAPTLSVGGDDRNVDITATVLIPGAVVRGSTTITVIAPPLTTV